MSQTESPTLYWMRRDLRLADNPGWEAALAGGRPVIPVFILDPVIEDGCGAAPKWRLERALASLGARLAARGSRLVLRRGTALGVLRALIAETGARRVVWSRQYEPAAKARDTEVKAALRADGVAAESVNAALLFEPWEVATGTGGYYKVYTPFWKAVRGREVDAPLPEPADLAPPGSWPASDSLADWGLGRGMNRGADVVAPFAIVGEAAARQRLDLFLGEKIAALQGRARPPRPRRHLAPVAMPGHGRDRAAHPVACRMRGDAACGRGRGDLPAGDRVARLRLSPAPSHAAPRDGQLAPRMGRVPLGRDGAQATLAPRP